MTEGESRADAASVAVVTGPVRSRRYGWTLGIDPIPRSTKLCTFNCAYCQLGWAPSDHGDPRAADPAVFASPTEVTGALERASRAAAFRRPDALVICGSGEPTLHPDWPSFVDAVLAARDRVFASTPVVCLTNGSELDRFEVRDALDRLDETAVKLDVGSYRAFRRVNMPRVALDLKEVAARIGRLRAPVVQSCFFEGAVANVADEDVEAWAAAVRFVGPRRVDIYSVSRSPPHARIRPASSATLGRIAARAALATRTRVRVFAQAPGFREPFAPAPDSP